MLLALEMGEGDTSWGAHVLLKLGKARKWILPWRLQKEPSPAYTLMGAVSGS